MVDATLISKVYETYKEPMTSCAAILKEQDVDAAKAALQKFYAEHKEEFASMYKSVPESDREEVLKTVFMKAAQFLIEQGCPEETVKTFMTHVKEVGQARVATL